MYLTYFDGLLMELLRLISLASTPVLIAAFYGTFTRGRYDAGGRRWRLLGRVRGRRRHRDRRLAWRSAQDA